MIARAIELSGKSEEVSKVDSSILATFVKSLFRMAAIAVEGLIEGICQEKGLVSNNFTYNWNRGNTQVSSLKMGAR